MYIFARYQPPLPPEMGEMVKEGDPAQIEAMDAQGLIWAFREDSQVGDWLEFLATGGEIQPEGTPMPDPPPQAKPIEPDIPMPPQPVVSPQGEMP